MSYDIDIYGRVELTPGEMVELASAQGLVPVNDVRPDVSPAVVPLRHFNTGQYALTLAGAYRIEPEDLPPGRSSELAGADVLYRIVVEGSQDRDVPVAKELGERLALQVRGEMVDLQNQPALIDELVAGPITRGFLHAEWYYAKGSEGLMREYVAHAREVFPQAVPDRFGTHDPLSGKISRDGDEGLDRFYREQCAASSLMIKGTRPFVRGLVSGWSDAAWPSIRLTFEYGGSTAVDLHGLNEFFVEFARRSGSFFACVELNDREFVSAVAQSVTGAWPGLPRIPQWLTWFSSDYADLVRSHLASDRVRSHPEGLVHRWSKIPVSAEDIDAGSVGSPWLPERLLPTQDHPENPRIATRPASLMPAALRPAGNKPRRPLLARLFGSTRSDEI